MTRARKGAGASVLKGQDLVWVEARRRFHLSHAQIQMARELGMNPKNFGKIANHRQEPWKEPLPQFIERLYQKRFGQDRPAALLTIEERARQQQAKRAMRKEIRRMQREGTSEVTASGVRSVSDNDVVTPSAPSDGLPR